MAAFCDAITPVSCVVIKLARPGVNYGGIRRLVFWDVTTIVTLNESQAVFGLDFLGRVLVENQETFCTVVVKTVSLLSLVHTVDNGVLCTLDVVVVLYC